MERPAQYIPRPLFAGRLPVTSGKISLRKTTSPRHQWSSRATIAWAWSFPWARRPRTSPPWRPRWRTRRSWTWAPRLPPVAVATHLGTRTPAARRGLPSRTVMRAATDWAWGRARAWALSWQNALPGAKVRSCRPAPPSPANSARRCTATKAPSGPTTRQFISVSCTSARCRAVTPRSLQSGAETGTVRTLTYTGTWQ